MFKIYRADMHIHTCLSPCGDWAMSPKAVVEKSRDKNLDIIAVCDHNSAENAEAAMRAGKDCDIKVLPGMEICSKEEVHVVAVFETLEQALAMQELVYRHLPGENNTDLWGNQIVANEHNEVMAENFHLLIGATTMGLYQVVKEVHALSGICIASHVDRPAFGIISNLGFIPPDLAFDAVEVSYRVPLEKAREIVAGIENFSCVTASDAHYPEDIGRAWTGLELERPDFGEIRMALHHQAGRRIVI